jgi:hypothetical protein
MRADPTRTPLTVAALRLRFAAAVAIAATPMLAALVAVNALL